MSQEIKRKKGREYKFIAQQSTPLLSLIDNPHTLIRNPWLGLQSSCMGIEKAIHDGIIDYRGGIYCACTRYQGIDLDPALPERARTSCRQFEHPLRRQSRIDRIGEQPRIPCKNQAHRHSVSFHSQMPQGWMNRAEVLPYGKYGGGHHDKSDASRQARPIAWEDVG